MKEEWRAINWIKVKKRLSQSWGGIVIKRVCKERRTHIRISFLQYPRLPTVLLYLDRI